MAAVKDMLGAVVYEMVTERSDKRERKTSEVMHLDGNNRAHALLHQFVSNVTFLENLLVSVSV